MFNIFLTKSGGFLGPIELVLGWILNAIYEFLSLFHIENVGIVIILFTFIARGLMIPLTIKQQKYSKLSSKMNPELTAINNKYKGKKDEASLKKMQLETQAVYQKYGASPTAGCLPLLIQLPIMFALYQVIYRVPAYVNDIKEIYGNISEGILGTNNYVGIMTEFAEKLNVSLKSFKEIDASNVISSDHLIDILSKFKSVQWAELVNKFPTLQGVIETNSAEIMRINSFIGGLNILDEPGLKFPGIIIPILAAGLSYIQGKQTQSLNTNTDKNNPMASTMSTMSVVMPITSGIFTIMLPLGVGLYWVAGSLFAILQQFFINRHLKKIDVDELIEKNVLKANKRKAKMGIDTKTSMADLARTQTKSIDSNKKESATPEKTNNVTMNENKNESYKSGSIADYANILKNRKNDKGDK